MNFIAQVVWIFPKFDTIYLFYIFLMGVAAFIYVKVMNYIQNKQTSVVNHWVEFQRFAVARKCNQVELNILHAFYDHLSEEEREIYLLPENRNKLKNALYRYFLKSNANTTEKEVDLFDKLFRSGVEFKKEILSLNELTIGEVAALEADGREELTYVMQKTTDELLLSVKGLSKDLLVPGKEAKLYVFRPSSGGYLLEGKVVRTNESGVIFHFNGKIERKGESHLMLTDKVSITVSPWPPPDEKKQVLELDKNKLLLTEENIDKQLEVLKRIAKDQKENNEKRFDIKETPRPFITLSERLSDRGILFSFPPGTSSEIWKQQDLWEVSFSFENGPMFHIRAKMMPTKQKSDLYLLRYVDADETVRKTLYEEIRKRGGIREVLT
ncbi:hypothetical protein [Leptospira bandrabouensis]|uniref:PilZ domain-containing protein n=1 Tax=Leptospira bandrabouensis TaxID=2484903 RepID=A0A6H3NNT4_9LEPT|nr:hypothetical protein [Leptospira bandrabouensis]MCG6143073.1 hypothetical protein [Leptospira bandrabouensis]MCG6151896.1 hypothetical protein [Leptospira bandrabouensis]MCG6158732.1 hypothetical protein [Leptospira bandrabouensis]MCG6162668.1 hypothetical protein [Leptospira bandrabouensis]MCW7459741.1 hypothetical protein [Leptospira bandrabouensis]